MLTVAKLPHDEMVLAVISQDEDIYHEIGLLCYEIKLYKAPSFID